MAWLEIVLYLTGVVLVALLIFAFTRLKNQLSSAYILMLLAVLVYVLGYAREIGSHSVDEVKFWLKAEYFGIPYISLLWFLFTYKICYGRSLSFPLTLAACAIPVLTTFFSATNDYSHFIYRNVSVLEFEGLMIAQLEKGFWYYIHIVYANCLIVLSFVFIIRQLWKTKNKAGSRLFWMALGSGVVIVVESFYFLGFSPYNIDLAPFGFIGAVLCQAVAIFRFDFLRSDDCVKDVVFANIKEGLLVLDAQDRISDFNKTAQQIYPWLNADCLGRKITAFEEGKNLCALSEQKSEIGVACGTKHRYFSVHMTELADGGHRMGKVYLFKDVTAIRRIMRKLYRYANYDSLTCVFNRRRFLDDGEKEISRCIRYHKRISYIMIDLDHFKSVNDRYGHQAGDKVLHEIARVMRKRLRKSDILGRYGGEEFGIFLVEVEPESALTVAEDIRKSIECLTIAYQDVLINITVSVGLATSHGDSPDLSLEHLLNKADMAMYKAKQAGGNQICSAP